MPGGRIQPATSGACVAGKVGEEAPHRSSNAGSMSLLLQCSSTSALRRRALQRRRNAPVKRTCLEERIHQGVRGQVSEVRLSASWPIHFNNAPRQTGDARCRVKRPACGTGWRQSGAYQRVPAHGRCAKGYLGSLGFEARAVLH